METTVRLKDGRSAVIRDMRPTDLEPLVRFFLDLPEEDRRYLRYDVTRRETIARRMDDIARDRVVRLVALDGDRIVADGALELLGHGWGEDVAEIRLIVAKSHQRSGLGTLMAREMFCRAAERRVERIVVRMMRPQRGARSIFRRLGFRDEFFIPEQVRDRNGEWQDLVLMRCNLKELWAEMEDLTEAMDGNRCR